MNAPGSLKGKGKDKNRNTATAQPVGRRGLGAALTSRRRRAMDVVEGLCRLRPDISATSGRSGWAMTSMAGGLCWLGGWDKCRIVFLVMVKRVTTGTPGSHSGQRNMSSHEGCVAAAMRLGDAKKTP